MEVGRAFAQVAEVTQAVAVVLAVQASAPDAVATQVVQVEAETQVG